LVRSAKGKKRELGREREKEIFRTYLASRRAKVDVFNVGKRGKKLKETTR